MCSTTCARSCYECVMMYLEGIEDGAHFVDSARKTTARKPVVVLRGGLTESGGRAAASHTGALAGSAEVFRAAARQSGVVTCGTVEELVDLGACLAYLPLPKGRRVAIVTNGGGPGVWLPTRCSDGLDSSTYRESGACSGRLLLALGRRNPLDWSRGFRRHRLCVIDR